MYPRLKLARNLLRDDGVIFISIDDNEQANLKRLCDEVFGEQNFVTTLHVHMSTVQGQKVSAAKAGNIVKNAEYVLVYSKDGRKNIAKNVLYDSSSYDTHYSIYLEPDGLNYIEKPLSEFVISDFNGREIAERFGLIKKDTISIKNMALLYSVSNEFRKFIHENSANIARDDNTSAITIPDNVSLQSGYVTHHKAENRDYLLTINSNGTIRQRILLSEKINQAHDFLNTYGAVTIRGDWWGEFYKDMGNVSKEGDITFANGKKPIRLIKQIVYMLGLEHNDIILDFFSGSATTAHAVMQLNAEDGGKRKFIMVQIPEACDEKSEAFKAGYKTIADIGKERIRRAGQKIKQALVQEALPVGEALASTTESTLAIPFQTDVIAAKAAPTAAPTTTPTAIDIGFRVLKIDSSNMNDVYYSPDAISKDDLHTFIENIKPDRTDEDLLFQVLLDWGVDLSLPIERKTIDDKTVFIVANDAIVACFDRNGGVTEAFITELATLKPLRAVFCDAGFASDSVKINIEQIFKLLSPSTDIKTI
jgi:adenine-specific DNA-methyltransferase